MGILAVDGYGLITQSNAKEIYTAWKKGEVDLSISQQKYTESFLSEADMDDISYDTDVSYDTGKDKINTEGTEEGSQTGNAVGTTVGAVGMYFAAALLSKVLVTHPLKNCAWTAVIAGAIDLACGVASVACANAFDEVYNNRTAARDNADTTNSTIDGYSDSLISTMDMMNEDMVIYEEQQGELTMSTNEITSQMASLQVELASAMDAGDKKGAADIQKQINTLQSSDMSGYTDALEETESRLTEYEAANSESLGVRDAGQSVSDFLKEGTGLGVIAAAGSVTLGLIIAKEALGIAAILMSPKFPWESIPAAIAAGLVTAAVVLFGTSAYKMGDKAVNEFECGAKGSDIKDHVDSLNDTIGEQASYTEQTSTSFEESDAEAKETMKECQKTADEAVAKNTGKSTGGNNYTPGNSNGGNPFASGGGSGSGSGSTNT